jgi:ribosomal protein S18 acetylase RimI-like enzyme
VFCLGYIWFVVLFVLGATHESPLQVKIFVEGGRAPMWQKYIDGQYRKPSGIVGRWIGRKMARQHQPENLWTVNLLNV